MMKQRIAATIIGVASFFTLLFGVGAGHSVLAASMMPDMGKQMPQGQCQSSCTPQANAAINNPKTIVDNKDTEPSPVEPYYAAFIGVGWSLILAAGIYLLWHLLWRPPDIIKLHVAYRF